MSKSARSVLALFACAVIVLSFAPLAQGASPPPGWTQIASGGLGNPENMLMVPIAEWSGKLYSWIPNMTGGPGPAAPLWVYDGKSFSKGAPDGFGDEFNRGVIPGVEYQGYFYVGTENDEQGAQLWRSADGAAWERVGADVLDDPDDIACNPVGVQGGKLIFSMDNYSTRAKVYCFDGQVFERANVDGFGMDCGGLQHAVTFEGKIHAMGLRQGGFAPLVYNGGTDWTLTGEFGFGDEGNDQAVLPTTDGKQIFAGTQNMSGGQLWRYDGTWHRMDVSAAISPQRTILVAKCVGDELYVTASTVTDGPPEGSGEAYLLKPDGKFEVISKDGFGDEGNVLLAFGPLFKNRILVAGLNPGGFQMFEKLVGPPPPPAPKITKMTPAEGPCGTKITLTGNGFGKPQAASSVLFNGAEASAADTIRWSDTKIEVRFPESATSGKVSVKTPYGVSNEVDFKLTLSKTFYFAEGTTRNNREDGRFEEWLCLLNPAASSAEVVLDYLTAEGPIQSRTCTVPGRSRLTVDVAADVGADRDVSVMGRSSSPVAAERAIYFDYRQRWDGGSCVTGVPNPSEVWYFAEGTTRNNPRDGSFEPWLCLMNPTNQAASAQVTYLAGDEPVQLAVEVPPMSRVTRDVAADAGVDKDVSIVVRSEVPLVAERPMYFDYHSRWKGGDSSTGATGPSQSHYFAEGCTYPWADEWICVANPQKKDASVRLEYAMSNGTLSSQTLDVPAGSRRTADVRAAVGYDKDVAVILRSDVPVVAERSMYFDYKEESRQGGSFASGAPAPRKTLYFAEGTTRRNNTDGCFDQWLCIQNPNSSSVGVKLTFMKPDGIAITQSFAVGGGTRTTISVNQVLGPDMDAACVVEASAPITAERSMYFQYRGYARGGAVSRGTGI